MYFFNINQSLLFSKLIGCNPEKGYSKWQVILYLCSMLLSLSLLFLAVLLVIFNNGDLGNLDVPKAFSTCFGCSHVSYSTGFIACIKNEPLVWMC